MRDFESRFAEIAGSPDCRVVVDLAAADSIDSILLAHLIGADKAVRSVGGRMAVAVTRGVRRMLEQTGLEARLELHETSDAAVLSLAGP